MYLRAFTPDYVLNYHRIIRTLGVRMIIRLIYRFVYTPSYEDNVFIRMSRTHISACEKEQTPTYGSSHLETPANVPGFSFDR